MIEPAMTGSAEAPDEVERRRWASSNSVGPSPPNPARHASLEMWQQSNGYWACRVIVKVPQRFLPFTGEGFSFHNIREAMAFADQFIESAVLGS